MLHNDAISFILYPPDFFWLNFIKYLFIGFSAAAIVFILVFAFYMTSWFRVSFWWDLLSFFAFTPSPQKRAARQWIKISERLATGLESEYKLAVIEADSMFDDILKKMGYEGETLGERLDKIPATLVPDAEPLRLAHKTRNNVVHDPDYKLGLEDAKSALSAFEKVLVDLGIL